MIAHASLHVSDFAKAKAFYEKILSPLGYHKQYDVEEWQAAGFMGPDGNTDFWINADGCKQPSHIAFAAKSEKEVQDFYDAALANGATDNGAPGYRTDYGAGYYAAFVHDPDGNNVETMFWNAEKE